MDKYPSAKEFTTPPKLNLYKAINLSYLYLTGCEPKITYNSLKETSGQYKDFFFCIMKVFKLNPNDNMLKEACKIEA